MLRLVSMAFCAALLSGCGKSCAIRVAESNGYGDHRLDCSGASVEYTGKKCGDHWDEVVVRGCVLDTGEIVDQVLVMDASSSCFGRSPAGVCYE